MEQKRSKGRHLREAANETDKRAITGRSGAGPRSPSQLLFSIPDLVARQESQFADIPKNVFLDLAPTKENISAMYPTFSGHVMSPHKPVMSETRSRYFLCFLSWALLMFVSKGTVS